MEQIRANTRSARADGLRVRRDDGATDRRAVSGVQTALIFCAMLLVGLHLCTIIFAPPGSFLLIAGANVLQLLCQVLSAAICFVAAREATPATGMRRIVAVLFGLGILTYAIGQGLWTLNEVVLRRTMLFPSLADAGFLASFPPILLAILLLPTRPLSAAARTRTALDGLLVIVGFATVCWYYWLGPILLDVSTTPLARTIAAAYPLADLLLAACLLLLVMRSHTRLSRAPLAVLALGLLVIVVTDGIYGYQVLHEVYRTGTLLDVGWSLGYLLIALAVHLMHAHPPHAMRAILSLPERAGNALPRHFRLPALARHLLPYAVIPLVGLLLLLTWGAGGDMRIEAGVYVGAALLVALVLLRQVFTIWENYQLLEATSAHLARIEHLQTLATTDPLTRLLNHRAIIGALDDELTRARLFHRPCAVVFLDLDHFKALNDGYGHLVGDRVLRDVAALAHGSLRAVDSVGRWGGEEFVAVLPETDEADALDVAERLREAIATHTYYVGKEIHLTCSVGVAVFPHHGTARDDLVAAADYAMYQAKRLGRNQCRLAHDPAVSALLDGTGEAGGDREEMPTQTVHALVALVEARDAYTGQHTSEVAALTTRLALALGVTTTVAHTVALAGQLHDIGKVAVPDAALRKPGPLSEAEWRLMRQHPVIGADIVGRVPALRALVPIVRSHHEHWDGNGYPDRLAGDAIPLGARIVAVTDAYGALTSDRPYRRAQPVRDALAELRRCAGTQFDPAVVAAFVPVIEADLATTPLALPAPTLAD